MDPGRGLSIVKPPLMNTVEMKPDVLDAMIRQQQKHLQDLLRLRGQRYNPSNEVCKEFDIQKRYLAIGLIFQEKGNISIAELARRLSVDRTTIYTWPEIVRALKAS